MTAQDTNTSYKADLALWRPSCFEPGNRRNSLISNGFCVLIHSLRSFVPIKG
jgi:hypothetical protein